MSIFSYIICVLLICVGGTFFDLAKFGQAISAWLVALLISADDIITAIKKDKP